MKGKASIACLVVGAALLAASSHATGNQRLQAGAEPQPVEALAASKPRKVTYSERQLRLALYPCQDCHRLIESESGAEASGLQRKGKYHYHIDYQHFFHVDSELSAKIKGEREQGDHHRATCLVCHSATDRNTLRLPTSAGGYTVSFNASYRQCLSCHGDKKRDFDAGIHGKDIGGYGRSEKIRFQCVDCHNPHSPKIKAMKALPPPKKPRTLIPKKDHH